MEMSDQTLAEFAVLALTGIVVSAAAIMVTTSLGSLTRYAHGCWRLSAPVVSRCSCGPLRLVLTMPMKPGFGAPCDW